MAENNLKNRLMEAILNLISNIPTTTETKAVVPISRSRIITNTAAAKASLIAGGLCLPPGPLGIATILPDLISIWKIQSQMFADIAGAFGKQTILSREQMLYCLFKHAASQAVKDLVVRVGMYRCQANNLACITKNSAENRYKNYPTYRRKGFEPVASNNWSNWCRGVCLL